MPVHLPQLSRREFLKRAALAGATAALAPSVFAELAAKPHDPDAVFFLSDAHIAADAGTMAHGVNMTANLAAVVSQVAAWPVTPGAVIISGDLAFQRGLPEDYAAFGKLIEPLRALAPVHLLLGNHDERENFWKAFPLDATPSETVPQKQVAIFSSSRANWFLLDSLQATDARPGKLGAEQREWLAHELEARPDKPAVVVCHHNIDWIGEVGGLQDSLALELLLSRHRQVKAFVYGHTHDWHVFRRARGIQFINLPPTAYVFEPGRPSGWVRAAFADDGAEFELRSLNPKHAEHAKVKKLQWRAG